MEDLRRSWLPKRHCKDLILLISFAVAKEKYYYSFLEFLLRNDGSLFPESVDGLTYRNANGVICQNKFPDFLPDNYKRPYYYYDQIPSNVISNAKRMQIDVGRGCPFSCTYCSTKTFWKRKFRLRNLQDIVDEIQYVNNHFDINTFDFMHDLFTANKRRVLEFVRKFPNAS